MSQTLDVLPAGAQAPSPTSPPAAARRYALAVFLLAPVAMVVPLTISTAVGAATIVGERERGTGEFLAHSPAEAREIYLGKLIASLVPGYLTTLVGFGAYSLIVNLFVGPEVGGWFFPTRQWWVMMLWVVPPFLALALSIVLRLSARVKSTAAAQQASGLVTLPLIGIAYGQATGSLFGAAGLGWFIGAVAWVVALASLARGMRAVNRGPPARASPTASERERGGRRRRSGLEASDGERSRREAGTMSPATARWIHGDDAVARRPRTPTGGRSRGARGSRRPGRPPCPRRPGAGRRSRRCRWRTPGGSSTDWGLRARTWAPTSAKAAISSV